MSKFVATQAAGRRKLVTRNFPASAANRRVDVKLELNPKKQIPKKHMSKMDMLKKEKAVDKAVDDLLRDDDPETEQMDVVADPVPALETEKVGDDTETGKVDVADPIHAPETELDLADLLMLVTVAITHEDLKPYDV